MRIIFYLIFSFFFFPFFAQENADSANFIPKYRKGLKYEIKTTQNILHGFLVRETYNSVVMEEKRGEQTYEILKNSIISMRPVSDRRVLKEDLLGSNYHAHTYLFSASSIVFDEPLSYVNYQWLLIENINYGLTQNWSVTVNTLFLYPVSLGVKCNYEISPNTYAGGNVFVVGNVSDRVSPALFFGYGASARITRGTENNNFSFSGGVVGLNPDLFQLPNGAGFINLPYGSFAFANRFHQRWSFCLEAWMFPFANTGLAGGGFKFLKSDATSWTFGCYTYVNTANNQITPNLRALPIPYIGFTSNLGGY